ncbi:hypothetical protein ACFL58_04775, partial [Elusimicrobiota bacterium]
DISESSISIEVPDPNIQIAEGDRLRLSNPSTDKTIAFKIKDFSKNGSVYSIPFNKSTDFKCGNPVFKTVDAAYDQKNIEADLDSIYKKYSHKRRKKWGKIQVSQTYTSLISNKWKEIKMSTDEQNLNDTLWIRYDDIKWRALLPKPDSNLKHVFYLKKDTLHYIENTESLMKNIAFELPPFISQRDIPIFKNHIDKLISKGITNWVLNNVSQYGFFKNSDCVLTAGQFLYTWNAYTAAFLTDLGTKYFTASWEDEFLNIRKMCSPGLGKFLLVYLYGRIPVVRSRILTREMLDNVQIKDKAPEAQGKDKPSSFMPVFESDMTVLIPNQPLSIFTARKKLKECRIENFGVDLTFTKPDKNLWKAIFDGYNKFENPENTIKFNFKKGIK